MHLMPSFYIPPLYAYECKGASNVNYVDYGAPHLIIVPMYMQMPLHVRARKEEAPPLVSPQFVLINYIYYYELS